MWSTVEGIIKDVMKCQALSVISVDGHTLRKPKSAIPAKILNYTSSIALLKSGWQDNLIY